MQKKGVIEIQFNWVFIMIAGGLIIALFTGIALKQKELSDLRINTEIANTLSDIFAAARVSSRTLGSPAIPNKQIGFSCNEFVIGEAKKDFGAGIVFSPSVLRGNRMITWTIPWNFPYEVTNFLIITSPQIRFIFIGDNSNALPKEVNSSIPNEIPFEWHSSWPSDIEDNNNYKVMFISFNDIASVPDSIAGMEDEDVTAIKISKEPDVIAGKIAYYKKKGNAFLTTGETSYMDIPSLIGAIFTDDLENYNCIMKKAFKNLNIVAQIYERHALQIKGFFDGTDNCYGYYSDNDLRKMVQYSNAFSWSNINQLIITSNKLKSYNENLQRLSCPLIY